MNTANTLALDAHLPAQPTGKKLQQARKIHMAPATLEGQTLGKYRVLDPLGRGGMAQVYKAFHPQLERYVAIKVLRSDLVGEEEFLARFRREARAVAGLRHPNIVQVYDFDVEESQDLYYMVMELLEGDTLKASLNTYRSRSQAMPNGEIVRILLDVLSGLAYAHNEGIIHRDIKPANILLTRRGQAVLTDFGIAQIIGGTRYTLSGALMGTLHYMSPEQGLQGHGDIRSDLYSTGIVFYEMLTGRPPFDADTPLAILMKHVNDPLPLPHNLSPAIPEPFERVLLKALAKQPDDRYQSAGEMAQALMQASQEASVQIVESLEPTFTGLSGNLPGAPTAAAAKKPAVAVFSGAAREQMGDAAFAAGDTDAQLSQRLQAELMAANSTQPDMPASANALTFSNAAVDAEAKSKTPMEELGTAAGAFASALAGTLNVAAVAIKNAVEEEKHAAEQGQTSTRRQVVSSQWHEAAQAIKSAVEEESSKGFPAANRLAGQVRLVIEEQAGELGEPTPRPKPGHISQLFGGLAALLGGNAILFVLLGITGWWGILGYIWPIEMYLVSMFFGALMAWLSHPWLLVPGGIILGNGLLFTYFSLSGHWGNWLFLWPVEPAIVLISIWAALRLERRTRINESAWVEVRKVGRGLTMIAALLIPMTLAFGLLAMGVQRLLP